MSGIGKKKGIYLLACAIILTVSLFSSCVYDTELTYLNDQIVALNNRVTKLQESIDHVDQVIDERIESQSRTINANRADIMVEIDRVREETQELMGRVEDNEHVIKSFVERDLNDRESLRMEVEKLGNLVQEIEKLELKVNKQNEYLGLEPSYATESGQGQKEPSQPGRSADAGAQKPVEADIYDLSLSLYKEGKYEQSMEGFKRYLSENPKSDLADNAQFWIGECLMSLKQYELAILAYQEVIKKYPKGNKVPSAMFRQAIAWLEINDKTSSKILLRQLIKQFPDSNETEIAQKKLKQIE